MTAGLISATGNGAAALPFLERAASLRSTPEPKWVARHHAIKAGVLHNLLRFHESDDAFGAAVAAADALGDREQSIRALNNWAALEIQRGDLVRAGDHYARALSDARALQNERLIAWIGQNIAYVALLRGRFDEARAHSRLASQLGSEIAVARIWGQAVAYRLATLTNDAALLAQADIASALSAAEALESSRLIAFVRGAIIARELLARENVAAGAGAAWRAGGGLNEGSIWLIDVLGQAGSGAAADEARAGLVAAAEHPEAAVAVAHLQLFDARVLLRDRRRAAAEALARNAQATYERLGWALHAAYAAEVAGDGKGAIEAFRRIGASAEVTRLTTTDGAAPRRRGETTLTKREREIAALIGAEKTNRQIAEALVISERTVETHVAAIYQKLNVGSRRELSVLLDA